MSLGIEELNNGEYGSALFCFEKALERDPSYAEAYRYKGEVYGLVGDYDRAIEDLDKAVSLDFEIVEAYIARGHAYMENMDFDKAEVDFQKAVELDGEFVAGYVNSAYSSSVGGDDSPSFSPYDIIRAIRQYKIIA